MVASKARNFKEIFYKSTQSISKKHQKKILNMQMKIQRKLFFQKVQVNENNKLTENIPLMKTEQASNRQHKAN